MLELGIDIKAPALHTTARSLSHRRPFPVTIGYLTKYCSRCDSTKSVSEFYVRSGIDDPILPGHYVAYCKQCYNSQDRTYLHPTVSRVAGENLAIELLATRGIPALPGKAVSAADVDVVAWGHVWLEVKYSQLRSLYKHTDESHTMGFKFTFTPKQRKRGPLADYLMLICDYGDLRTAHFLTPDHSVFYRRRQGKGLMRKHGVQYVPGADAGEKHGHRYEVLSDDLMALYHNNYDVIWDRMREITAQLRRGEGIRKQSGSQN